MEILQPSDQSRDSNLGKEENILNSYQQDESDSNNKLSNIFYIFENNKCYGKSIKMYTSD